MFCKKCGEQISDDSEYCPVCGESQQIVVEQKEKNIAGKAVKAILTVGGTVGSTVGATILADSLSEITKSVGKKATKATSKILKEMGLKKKTPLDMLGDAIKKKRK